MERVTLDTDLQHPFNVQLALQSQGRVLRNERGLFISEAAPSGYLTHSAILDFIVGLKASVMNKMPGSVQRSTFPRC